MLLTQVLLTGGTVSILALSFLLITLYLRPRLLLRSYPPDIRNAAQPRTHAERRATAWTGLLFLGILLGVPFLSLYILALRDVQLSLGSAFLVSAGSLLMFNLVDLIVLDWIIICTITPSFVVIPGTEGALGYKDYGHHLRAFLRGTIPSVVAGGALALLSQNVSG